MATSKKTVKIANKAIKPRRVTKVVDVKEAPAPVAPVVAEAPVAPVVEAIEAPAVEATQAPAADAVTIPVPVVFFKDLKVSREGHYQIAPKTYKSLAQAYGKEAIRFAIQAMVALKEADVSLETGLLLVTWPNFRPFMLQQLAAVWSYKDREGVFRVLEWIWANEGWTFEELYEEFPRNGRPGLKASKEKLGKANNLLSVLDALRSDSKKTSPKGLDYLAQAVRLLGWIK